MARNLGPVCRLCRREGLKLFLKGERCYSDKCAIERRNYPPGAHGQARTRFSEFAIRLREKQKVKRIYGLMEAQFSAYFEAAERMDGITGENLLVLLERRLDNVVYRLGFASSLAQARQVVRHGHIHVNGKRVTIPSTLIEVGSVISLMAAMEGADAEMRHADSELRSVIGRAADAGMDRSKRRRAEPHQESDRRSYRDGPAPRRPALDGAGTRTIPRLAALLAAAR